MRFPYINRTVYFVRFQVQFVPVSVGDDYGKLYIDDDAAEASGDHFSVEDLAMCLIYFEEVEIAAHMEAYGATLQANLGEDAIQHIAGYRETQPNERRY